MGSANSKKHSGNLTKTGNLVNTDISAGEGTPYRNMEGPSFYCAYLGFTALSKPPTNLNVLQNPIKELYFKYRKTPASGRSANLKLIQNGVLVVLYENGAIQAELFFDFTSVTFVEAAKFVTVKTSSEKKPKAIFVPVDESKGATSDKNAFLLDKSYHFLIASTHPPLVVCVVRRPTGVKVLDCHVFALDTIENTLHISALIASAQSPTGQVNKVDSIGDHGKGKAVFDKGARGDVIRMDQTEYNIYRGPSSYDTPPTQRYSAGPVTEVQPGQWYGGGAPVQSPGRNGQMRPLSTGAVMLTQENFREQQHSSNQSYGVGPGHKGFEMYDQRGYGGPPGGGYLRQPDVIMHTGLRSGDVQEQHLGHDRSFSGQDQMSGGVQMRYDEVVMRNNANSRLSGGPVNNESRMSGGQVGNRHSAGVGPASGTASPRPQELRSSGHGQQYTQWQQETTTTSVSSMSSPRTSHPASPNNPHVFDQRDFGGPIYSASNLESRNQGPANEPDDHPLSGRPVAKVPPHMIGVKVLPSDFHKVKLKPKADKRPEVLESDSYDHNKDILGKYNDSPEHPTSKIVNYHSNDDIMSYPSQQQHQHNRYDDPVNREFTSQWNDPMKEQKIGRANESPNEVYRHGGLRDYRYEDNNNKHRISAPVYADESNPSRNWGGPRVQSSYDPGARPTPQSDNQFSRTKDMEIANMFSNFRIQRGDGRDMYLQPRDRNEFEDGLGYLP